MSSQKGPQQRINLNTVPTHMRVVSAKTRQMNVIMAACLFAFTGGVYYFSMRRLKQDMVMNYQFTDEEKAENEAAKADGNCPVK